MYRIEALGIQIYHFASQFLVVICGHGVTEHPFVTDSQSLLTSKVQSCILKKYGGAAFYPFLQIQARQEEQGQADFRLQTGSC